MNENTTMNLGRLTANIAGDHRYTDTLVVEMDSNTRIVTVYVTVTSAVGGMDGPGGSYIPAKDVEYKTEPNPNAKDVQTLVKRAINNERYNFKKYGKPTQRLWWAGGGKGFALAVIQNALETVPKT